MDLCVRLTVILLITIGVVAGGVQFQCPPDEGESSYPHQESCKKYYQCKEGIVKDMTCPYSFYFDVGSRKCISANDGRCPEEVEPYFKDEQIICNNDGKVKMVPHPAICSRYYICFGEDHVEKRCKQGLLFDADSRKCTFPQYARCNVDPWCPLRDNLKDLKFFPDSDNCARYAVCYKRKLHYQYCADGLFFNVERQQCTEPELADCKIIKVDCLSGASVIPHRTKLGSYYECIKGHPHYRDKGYRVEP